MLTTFSSPVWLLPHWILPWTGSSGDFSSFLPTEATYPPSPSWRYLFPRLLAKATSQLTLALFQSTECMLCSWGTWSIADFNTWFPCLKKIQRKLSHCSEDKTQGTTSQRLVWAGHSHTLQPHLVSPHDHLCVPTAWHTQTLTHICQVEAWRVPWQFLKHSLFNSLFLPCAIHFPLFRMVPPQCLPAKVFLIL